MYLFAIKNIQFFFSAKNRNSSNFSIFPYGLFYPCTLDGFKNAEMVEISALWMNMTS